MAKNFTPGWNDPPTLSYNPATTTGNVRNLLSKRVAFPVNNSAGGSDNNINAQPPSFAFNSQQTGAEVGAAANTYVFAAHNHVAAANDLYHRSASTPCFSQPYDNPVVASPGPALIPPYPIHSNTPVFTGGQSNNNVYNRAPPPQYSNFEIIALITNTADGCVSMPKSTRENVERKLAALKTTLENGSLSAECRSKLCALVENLSSQRYNEAYSIHSAMMIDHYNEVNSWMVGVKAIMIDRLKN